jgi:eukaryotic-like serine/threonine-protein kinase
MILTCPAGPLNNRLSASLGTEMNEPQTFGGVTGNEFGRLRAIFESALDRPPAARSRYVDDACAGDAALIEQVERMLRADAARHRFLDGNVLLRADRLHPGDIVATHLEVVDVIGRGGMGEVYCARDTKLGRDVALKVLPRMRIGLGTSEERGMSRAQSDDDRLARFRREAQVLASLNHPNIAAIHGLEESDGVHALVLELVTGPTLADRLEEGPIPLDDALPIAKQIAEALEAAHERGIVHRDLKPANIKLRPDGTVKLLDFGLAKILQPDATVDRDSAGSSTLTSPSLLRRGVILGTAAYVSPEQARGQEADRRSDIWAFGAVLYEMLSGRRAFPGEDVSDTIAGVLQRPLDWSALNPSTPLSIRRLLSRCLERDVRRRLRDIGEARIVLEDPIAAGPNGTSSVTARLLHRPWWRRVVTPLAAGIVAATGVGTTVWVATRPSAPHVSRFAVLTTANNALSVDPQSRDLTMTANGTHIVYKGGIRGSSTQLFVRGLDQLEPAPLTAPGLPKGPFSSPDGQWIGFFEPGRPVTLKKVAITGGPVLELSGVDGPSRGATWGEDNTIVFATAALSTGLQRVSSAGGGPTVLTTPSSERRERDHLWPQFLPGGQGVLFTITATVGGIDASQVAVLDVATGTWTTLVRGASQAQYVSSGHLVYVSRNALWAVAFDVEGLQTIGTASPVVSRVVTLPSGTAEFDIARNGTLAYVTGGTDAAPRTLVWVDRRGQEEAIEAPARPYVAARLSPDGTRVALEIEDQNHDIWVWDLTRKTLTRVTTDPGADRSPVWMPDGRRLLFSSQAGAVLGSLFWQAADGTGIAERLLPDTPYVQRPSSLVPDGTRVLFMEGADLMTVTLDQDRRVQPVIQTAQSEQNGAISPDGRWLAYDSNDSGPSQIFVRPLPNANEGKTQVSTGGGSQPLWSRNGRELFYLATDGAVMSVSVEPGRRWTAGMPTKIIESAYFGGMSNSSPRTYDVSPDGQRFLMLKRTTSQDPPATPARIVIVQNWMEELKRLVPHGR